MSGCSETHRGLLINYKLIKSWQLRSCRYSIGIQANCCNAVFNSCYHTCVGPSESAVTVKTRRYIFPVNQFVGVQHSAVVRLLTSCVLVSFRDIVVVSLDLLICHTFQLLRFYSLLLNKFIYLLTYLLTYLQPWYSRQTNVTTITEHCIAAFGLNAYPREQIKLPQFNYFIITSTPLGLCSSQLGGSCCVKHIAVLHLTVDGCTSHIFIAPRVPIFNINIGTLIAPAVM